MATLISLVTVVYVVYAVYMVYVVSVSSVLNAESNVLYTHTNTIIPQLHQWGRESVPVPGHI
jgi:hypothetical protein